MPADNNNAQLLVEGKNDQHVIWALCDQHQIAKTFTVEIPRETEGGVDILLDSIPVRLKIPRLRALGIVLDADQDIRARWESLKSRLVKVGYRPLPDVPAPLGTIIDIPGKPKIGVWIMPDNKLPGMLEDFVAYLIPEGDILAMKARTVLRDIEHEHLNKYPPDHHAKAFIHTWLAWQRVPGQPMGQAITVRSLSYDAPLAQMFAGWLQRLFQE